MGHAMIFVQNFGDANFKHQILIGGPDIDVNKIKIPFMLCKCVYRYIKQSTAFHFARITSISALSILYHTIVAKVAVAAIQRRYRDVIMLLHGSFTRNTVTRFTVCELENNSLHGTIARRIFQIINAFEYIYNNTNETDSFLSRKVVKSSRNKRA